MATGIILQHTVLSVIKYRTRSRPHTTSSNTITSKLFWIEQNLIRSPVKMA